MGPSSSRQWRWSQAADQPKRPALTQPRRQRQNTSSREDGQRPTGNHRQANQATPRNLRHGKVQHGSTAKDSSRDAANNDGKRSSHSTYSTPPTEVDVKHNTAGGNNEETETEERDNGEIIETDQNTYSPTPRPVIAEDPEKLNHIGFSVRLSHNTRRIERIEARLDKQGVQIDKLVAQYGEIKVSLDETKAQFRDQIARLEQYLYEKLGAPSTNVTGHNAAGDTTQQQQHHG